jgi:hypothetical protein
LQDISKIVDSAQERLSSVQRQDILAARMANPAISRQTRFAMGYCALALGQKF